MAQKIVEQIEDELSRREQILRISIQTFSEKGYHGASVQEIARKVGLHKTSLFHYFPSKEDLLFAILKRFGDEMVAGLEGIYSSDSRPTEKLRRALYYHLDAIVERSDEFKVSLESKHLGTRRRNQIRTRRKQYLGVIQRMIQDGVDCGELQVDDVGVTASCFMGLIMWIYPWYRSGRFPPEDLARRFWELMCSIASPTEAALPSPA